MPLRCSSSCRPAARLLLVAVLCVTAAHRGSDGDTEPPNPPAIGLPPTSVTFDANEDGDEPATRTVAITNGGGAYRRMTLCTTPPYATVATATTP